MCVLSDVRRIPQSAVPLSIQIDLLYRFETPSNLRPCYQPLGGQDSRFSSGVVGTAHGHLL